MGENQSNIKRKKKERHDPKQIERIATKKKREDDMEKDHQGRTSSVMVGGARRLEKEFSSILINGSG